MCAVSQEAFAECKQLATITLGDSVTAIRRVAPVHALPIMYPAAALAAVAICIVVGPFLSSGPPVRATLTCRWPVPCAQGAFADSGLTEIVVPDSVEEIGAV